MATAAEKKSIRNGYHTIKRASEEKPNQQMLFCLVFLLQTDMEGPFRTFMVW